MAIKDYSTTPALNTSLFPEGMAPSAVNDSARQVQADIRSWYEDAEWTDLGHTITYASATSFTITGMDVTDEYHAGRRVRAVGTTTGTIYGTIQSSAFVTDTTVTVTWDSGSLENETLAVSLAILRADNPSLPTGGAVRDLLNFGTMASQDADNVNITGGSANFTGSLSMESTSAGATEEPVAELYRNRSSPSNNEDLGAVHFTGNDSGGNKHSFAAIETAAETVTDGAEDGLIRFQTSRGGSVLTARMIVGAGVWMQGATGGDPGSGKINAQEYQINGVNIFPVGATQLKTTSAERDWVLARIAAAAVGAVGTYAFLHNSGGTTLPGETRPASQLRYSNAAGDSTGTQPSGTWRCMGYMHAANDETRTILWLRVS